MMVIDNKYEIGDFVYLSTDVNQLKRIVGSIKVCAKGELTYELICGSFISNHYEFELSQEPDIVLKSTQ